MMRKAVKQRGEPCHICGQAIDYDAPHLDPGEFTIDHIIPFSKGRADALHNVAAAHRYCNRLKSAYMPGEQAKIPKLPTPVEASPIW